MRMGKLRLNGNTGICLMKLFYRHLFEKLRMTGKAYLFTFLVVLIPCLPLGASNTEPRFRTIKISNPDEFMAPPVIRLGSDDRLSINFDELGDEYSELRYRLIHCNSDWQPSALVESEYIGGFNEKDIDDYAFSSNTFFHYVNYQITIPSENMPILHSGNYKLEVYDKYNPDTILMSVKFMVTETIASIKGEVSGRTDKGFNSEWQQLRLVVDLPADASDVYRYLNMVVMQNGREITRRVITTPSRMENNNLEFEHLPELIFPASNEYRRFENVSTSFAGLNTDSVKYSGSGYHVWINKDFPRKGTRYIYDSTQHGRFLVRENNSTDSNLGADYVMAHFFLEMPELLQNDVYIDGEFTGGIYSDQNRMTYNRERGGYELEIMLKQGAYNYQYVAIDKVSGAVDSSCLEGNMHETRNEYWVAVYYRYPNERADRLIGFSNIVF